MEISLNGRILNFFIPPNGLIVALPLENKPYNKVDLMLMKISLALWLSIYSNF